MPFDFGAPMVETLQEAFKSGYCVDWLNEDTMKEPDGTEVNRAYFIRPAVKCNPKLLDTSTKGECVFLTDSGCKLSYDTRPTGCKLLNPDEHGRCVSTGGTVRDSVAAWRYYTGAILGAIHGRDA
jgi:Fe-S-cluster containining protein